MTKLFLIIALSITFTACGGDKAGGAAPKAGGAVPKDGGVNIIKCPANWERDGYKYHGFGLCKTK